MSLSQLHGYDFEAPTTLDDACLLMSRNALAPGAVFAVAGCTDWMVERHLTEVGLQVPSGIAMSVAKIPELLTLEVRGDRLLLGAAVTFLQLRNSRVIAERCPLLSDMAKDVGAVQIQARGTLGGNLVSGSPAADGVTALFALDAHVVLRNTNAERAVPICDFFTGYRRSVRQPDELVVRFDLQLPAKGACVFWRKVGTRSAQSIAKAALSALAEKDANDCVTRFALGASSVAERVVPLHAARSLVLGRNVRDIDLSSVLSAVRREIRPIDDIRSTARYRSHIIETLVGRFLQDSLGVKG